MQMPMHKSNRVAFAYFMQAQRLLTRAFGGYLRYKRMYSSYQKAQA